MDQNSLEDILKQLATLIEKIVSNTLQNSKEGFISIPLPLFHGRDGENARSWVRQVDTIFEAMGIPDQRRVATAASYLRDTAQQWYQSNKLMKDTPKEWQAFGNKLIAAFERADYQMSLCNQLKMLRQTKSIQDYVFQFRIILGQLDSFGDIMTMTMFINGLKPRVRTQVIAGLPKSLEEAIKLAVSYDAAINWGKTLSSYTDKSEGCSQNAEDDNGTMSMEHNNVSRKRTTNFRQKQKFQRFGKCYNCRE
ncbi:uncharacterized protein VTP21DRAFT_9094 [Calcarisporiella thermophila]|uniref:uncharacterized protein n=1 Tax=Calcarisporiella thermophila TaxID=911321 RepID=UPI0037436ECA